MTLIWHSAGAKDLPRVAKQMGLATGRAVSYVAAVRKQALSFADETEISKASARQQLLSKLPVTTLQVTSLREDSSPNIDSAEVQYTMQLHQEVQASMQQLQALRSEMRTGINVFSHSG